VEGWGEREGEGKGFAGPMSNCFLYAPGNIYRVAQNKIPHRRICNISATNGLIFKILEAA